MFAIGPDVPHPYGTPSWPPLYELWGWQMAELLPALQPEHGSDKGHPDGVWISSSPLTWPSVWSSRRCLKSCTLWEEIHSITIVSIGSSCCTPTKSVTCKFMHVCAACAWTAVSSTYLCILSLSSVTNGSWPLALPVVPTVTPSRMNFTASVYSFDATWLRASAMALSLPFLHLMLNVNPAYAGWHQYWK